MGVGRLIRFDDVRGYGFIAPSGGGEDVFVHANDFGDKRHQVYVGMRVEYEVEESDRGLKAAWVRIIDGGAPPAQAASGTGTAARPRTSTSEDDGRSDVLTMKQYLTEVTELLVQHVPTLTAGQITDIRGRLVDHARSHGWVES